MRLLETFENEQEGRQFSSILLKLGISHIPEVSTNRDWGSGSYGTPSLSIWIIEEDQMNEAKSILEEYRKDPVAYKDKLPQLNISSQMEGEKIERPSYLDSKVQTRPIQMRPWNTITSYLILLCCLLFIWGNITAPHVESVPAHLPATAVLSPQIDKDLYYDYPRAFTYVDRLIALYGIEKLFTPSELPKEGQYLFAEYLETPFWQGYYKKFIQFFKNKTTSFAINAPIFEKIQEGEIWRVWSPCLLHSDIFHILFNMMWLAVLGPQIEMRLKPFRYLLFILITGLFSNTMQYMMSGANFIGISGVLCAMLGLIAARQKVAPWEGYLLQRGTIGLIAFFILVMFAIQVASFVTESFYNISFSPGVANTAHLSGAFAGYLLGRWNLFGKAR